MLRLIEPTFWHHHATILKAKWIIKLMQTFDFDSLQSPIKGLLQPVNSSND